MQALADKQMKEKEAADLDDDAAKRRQRVALWQEQRRAAEQAEEAERKKREEAAETWTLDDDIENEFGQVCKMVDPQRTMYLFMSLMHCRTITTARWISFQVSGQLGDYFQ